MLNTDFTLIDLVFMLKGAGITLLVTALSVLAGTIMGVLFGLVRYQVGPIWAAPLTFVLDVFRSVPADHPADPDQRLPVARCCGWVWDPFTTSCVVLSLYTASYCSEIVRGGIEAVPMVTRRAARSLGMTWGQDMRFIVAAAGDCGSRSRPGSG